MVEAADVEIVATFGMADRGPTPDSGPSRTYAEQRHASRIRRLRQGTRRGTAWVLNPRCLDRPVALDP